MKQKEQQTGRFNDLKIGKKLLFYIEKKGFKVPTPIQHQVIPAALDSKDIVGIAQTGTGKTLAFGIPMMQNLAQNKGQGLILVPTRELALQVEEAFRQIGDAIGLRCAVIIGGVAQSRQVRALNNNPHIVIATPGRLDDIMNQGLYSLKKVKIITLDEADRMLDVGFLPQIKRVLQTAPKERQTMLFSATMPKTISGLASAFMKMPLRIEIAPQGTSAENVEQEVFVITKNDKMRLLDYLLGKYQKEKILIFSRTKYGAKRIARGIRHMQHTATEIHSNRTQAQRKAALSGFKNGKFRILVATDIAARGIDVKDIALVINFDLPDHSEDYVHRIGRTARAGKTGKAISFVNPSEKASVRKIERLINQSLLILSLPELPAVRKKNFNQQNFSKSRSIYLKQRNHRKSNFSYSKYASNNRRKSNQEQFTANSRSKSSSRKKSFKTSYSKHSKNRNIMVQEEQIFTTKRPKYSSQNSKRRSNSKNRHKSFHGHCRNRAYS